jgi:uncharacterized protein
MGHEIGMVRIVLIICLICLLFVIIQKLRQSWQVRQKPSVTRKQMIQCVVCSIYLPKDDALRKGDHYFCCADHMETESKKN